MATGGDPVYTPETANGARLQALLIDEGTPLVRKLFDNEVSKMNPPSLQTQLMRRQAHFTDPTIPRKKILNADQQKILYPPTGTVANSSEHFDMSLLSLLLGRLCNMKPPKTTGWGKAPPLWDKSPIAWIIRLRLFRNENVGHITNTALSDTKFKKLWKQLSDILIELGADKDKLIQRKTQTIDPEQVEMYINMYKEKFEKLHREDNKVKDLLDDWGKKIKRSVEENAEKQTSEIKKMRKDQQRTERTHGKQHKQHSDKLSKLGEGQTAMIEEQKKQSTQMERAEKETQSQLRTSIQQQQGLIEGQKAMRAEGQKQTQEIKSVKEAVSELKEELKEQKPFVAEEAKPSAEGQTPIFETLRNHQQGWYRGQLANIQPLPWCEDWYLDLEDMFTTLEMVCRDGQKKDTAVAVEDMFKLCKDHVLPKTIRVEGNPGIGKTTLCYKIVYDCSAKKSKFDVNNKFSSFKLVLYVEMRQVPHDATDIKSTIFQQVFPAAYYKHEKEFWNYVECNPEDVLFVLDGLDEMPEQAREKLQIAQFIRGQIIPDVHVIVTSRPYLCNKQLTSCDRHFVIKGYSHENTECYIHKHPKLDSNSKSGMLKQLNENESLHQLCKNPLNLALLCVMWQKDWSEAELPQTLTGLYSLLVLAIIKRYATKCLDISDDEVSELSLEQMPEPIQGNVYDLSVLAWKGIKKDCLSFFAQEVKGLVEIGFLTKDLNLTTLIQKSYWFQFLHKTFQEYFAAKYLYSLCVTTGEQSSKASNVLKEYVQYKRYQQVLKFLAGLLGTNARCLFEAFHVSLSTHQDDRIVSLCLECLHECEAGTELVTHIGDVLPRDWQVGQSIPALESRVYEAISHKCNHYNIHIRNTEETTSTQNTCVLSCKTNMSSHQRQRGCKTYFITSNEALYGLVHLLHHQAKQHSSQDNPQLSNVHLGVGLDHATCLFLRKVSGTKLFRSLLVELDLVGRHESLVDVCKLLQSDAYRDLTCGFSLYSYCNSSSALDIFSKVLFSVQPETRLTLHSCVCLDKDFDLTSQGGIDKMVRLGSETKEGEASVELYIDCADGTYVELHKSVSSFLSNIVTTIEKIQIESSHSRGRLKLLFFVKNLPLSEKPAVQSQLADISSILEDSSYYIIRQIAFECSCEDGSVMSTIPLLQSLVLNQSLAKVSFLCDDSENVARCLHDIFAKNKTLQELEIGFLHPVDDETIANIFDTYPKDSPCKVTSFSVVIMETGALTAVRDHRTYEQTIRAILNICKNLCGGSGLQNISFNTNPEYTVINSETEDKVSKVKPVCPGSLLKPLVEAIVNSQLTVKLASIIWEDNVITRIIDLFKTGKSDLLTGLSDLQTRLSRIHSQSRHTNLQIRTSDLETEPLDLETGPSNLLTRPSDLQTGPLDLQSGLLDMLTRVSSLQLRLSDLITRVSSLQTDPLDVLTRPLNIRTRLSGLQLSISDLLTRVSGLQTDPLDVLTRPADLKTGLSDLKLRLSDLLTSVSDLQTGPLDRLTRPADIQTGLSNLKLKIFDLKHRLSDLKLRLSDLLTSISDLQTGPSDLQTRLSVSDLQLRLSDLQTRLSDLLTRPSDLQTRLSDLLIRPSDLLTRPSDPLTRPSDPLTRPSDLQTGLSDLQLRLSDLQNRVSDVLTRPSDLQTGLSDLQTRLSHLLTILPHVYLQPGRSVMLTRLSDLQLRLSDLQTRLSDLQTRLADLLTRPADLLTRPADLLTRPADLLTRPADLKTGLSDLQPRLSELQNEVYTLDLETAELPVPGLQTGLSDLQLKLSDLQTGLSVLDLQTGLSDLLSRLSDLKTSLSDLGLQITLVPDLRITLFNQGVEKYWMSPNFTESDFGYSSKGESISKLVGQLPVLLQLVQIITGVNQTV